jgi:hypothetical protein
VTEFHRLSEHPGESDGKLSATKGYNNDAMEAISMTSTL